LVQPSGSRRDDFKPAPSAKAHGKEEMLAEVLEEISRVRSEMGYPIMVTPFAQFVGSQAAINVIWANDTKK